MPAEPTIELQPGPGHKERLPAMMERNSCRDGGEVLLIGPDDL